jgi:hypothetical protein
MTLMSKVIAILAIAKSLVIYLEAIVKDSDLEEA